MNKVLLIIICLIINAKLAKSQNQSISQLFYPNISIQAKSYTGASVIAEGANKELGLTRTNITGFVPLRSEVQAGIGFRKKLDLRAIHTVAAVHLAQNDRDLGNSTQNYKTVSAAVLQLQASIRQRLWIYGAGIGYTEAQESFFTPRPYFWAGGARIRVLGVGTQVLYGSALLYNQKFKVIPVFGLNKKLGKKWRVSGILPFNASLSYKFNEWCNIEWLNTMRGYSAGYQTDIAGEKVPFRENLKQINTGLSLNFHLIKAFNISVEGGVSGMRTLNTFNAADKKIGNLLPNGTTYIGVGVRYLTSKSKFSSKFMNRVGIDV